MKGDWAVDGFLISQSHLFYMQQWLFVSWLSMVGTEQNLLQSFCFFVWIMRSYHPEVWGPQLWQQENLFSDWKRSPLVVTSFWLLLIFLDSRCRPCTHWFSTMLTGSIIYSGKGGWAVCVSHILCKARLLISFLCFFLFFLNQQLCHEDSLRFEIHWKMPSQHTHKNTHADSHTQCLSAAVGEFCVVWV